MSKHDIAIMSDMGVREGILNLNESNIIKNLLQFSEITVEDVMTPRTVVNTADEEPKQTGFLLAAALYGRFRYGSGDHSANNEPLRFAQCSRGKCL